MNEIINVEKVIFETMNGIDSNIIIVSGEPYACISDLYNQLDMNRQTMMKIIDSDDGSFDGYVIKVNGNFLQVDETQPPRNHQMRGKFQKNTIYNFINEAGYNLLIQRINPTTVKDVTKRSIIINHQRGMAEVFTKYRKKEIVEATTVAPAIHPTLRSPEQVCKDKIDLGVYIADLVSVPRSMMIAVSLAEATRETGVSFEKYQKCLPPAEGAYDGAHISASDIGKPYGDNGRKVNKLLQSLGYINKDSGSWELTQFGKDFGGAMFHYTNEKNGHSGMYIQWPSKMRDIVEKHKDRL